jgi:hypothetical protein
MTQVLGFVVWPAGVGSPFRPIGLYNYTGQVRPTASARTGPAWGYHQAPVAFLLCVLGPRKVTTWHTKKKVLDLDG